MSFGCQSEAFMTDENNFQNCYYDVMGMLFNRNGDPMDKDRTPGYFLMKHAFM